MPWFKVDDNLAFHQKTMRAGNAAMGLWVRAGSWCAQQLTDGFVPADIARSLGTVTEARRLVSASLWLERDGGYEFWQWTEEGRQPTRLEVEAKRKEARERQRRAREKAAQSRSDKDRDKQRESLGESRSDSAVSHDSPDPTRPDPTLKDKTPSESGPRKRGTRLDPTWKPGPAELAWQAENRVSELLARRELAKFVDYWTAKSGPSGVKLDWPATWRNWLRNTIEREPASRDPRPSSPWAGA